MAAKPTPERIALACARNTWNHARRFPRQAATDFALLLFVGLMLLGLQLQVVTELLKALGESAQIFVNALPLAAGAIALSVRSANPAHVRRTAKGNWLEALQIEARSHAWWAVRRAGYFALMISALGGLALFDVTRMETTVASASAANAILIVCIPVAAVLARAAFQWKRLLCPSEATEHDLTRQRTKAEGHAAFMKSESPLLRGLASFVLTHTNPTLLWTKIGATLAASVTLIFMAISNQQPHLLLLGTVLAPFVISSSLELPIEQVYALGRSLPLSFRRLTAANVKISLIPSLVFGLPFLAAAPFVPDGLYWALILTLAVPGMAALLFLKLAIEQAFPQSKISRILFTFAAAVGVGVFSMQAPLIAPFIGVVLCVVWLLERGWGVWEFGYGERA